MTENPNTAANVETILSLLDQVNPLVFQPIDLTGHRVGLIGVDFIDGFCTPGAGNLAPTKANDQVETMIEAFNELAHRLDAPVLLLRDSHPVGTKEGDYPPHCEQGTGEDEIVPRLRWLVHQPNTDIVTKNCNSGVIGAIQTHDPSNAVFDWIRRTKIDIVITAGICTDICLGNFVLDLLSARTCGLLGPLLKTIALYEPATASYDLPLEIVRNLNLPEQNAHPQALYHAMSLRILQNQGVILTKSIL